MGGENAKLLVYAVVFVNHFPETTFSGDLRGYNGGYYQGVDAEL